MHIERKHIDAPRTILLKTKATDAIDHENLINKLQESLYKQLHNELSVSVIIKKIQI